MHYLASPNDTTNYRNKPFPESPGRGLVFAANDGELKVQI
jgi:hypothetical protein